MPQKERDQEIKWGQRPPTPENIHPERLLNTVGFYQDVLEVHVLAPQCPDRSCARNKEEQKKLKEKSAPPNLSMLQPRKKPLWLLYGYIIYCSRSFANIMLRTGRKKPAAHFPVNKGTNIFWHLGDNLHWFPGMLKFLLATSYLNNFSRCSTLHQNTLFSLLFLMFSVFNWSLSMHFPFVE